MGHIASALTSLSVAWFEYFSRSALPGPLLRIRVGASYVGHSTCSWCFGSPVGPSWPVYGSPSSSDRIFWRRDFGDLYPLARWFVGNSHSWRKTVSAWWL